MRAFTFVRQFTVNDDTKVDVPQDGVVLIVGPNNSGKSQSLRDIRKLISSTGEHGVVVRVADVEYGGTSEELLETLESDRSIVTEVGTGDRVDLGQSGSQQLSSVKSWWEHPSGRHIVAPYFVLHADTESRLEASKPAPSMNLFVSHPQHPLHHVYANPTLEARLASIGVRAFSTGLILDAWSGGDHWALRVGNLEPPNSPRPPQEYLDALRELPLLHQEGDGVRSMIGLLLRVLTGHQTISLIDEPEAFLHPPQARYVGRLLASEAASTSQAFFVSTHSTDVVHGVLEGGAATTLVRLTRTGNVNHAAVLDNAAVRKLWADPLLRYSNLLEGLFTDAVIVCEADADCKYFAAIRDTLPRPELRADAGNGVSEEAGDNDSVRLGESRRPDILFTSCGGKHKLHAAVEALIAVSIPVAVIADFDLLNEWQTVSRLLTAAGGDPESVEDDWKILNAALTSGERNPTKAGIKTALDESLDAIDGPAVTKKDIETLRGVLKIENGWDRVKKTGLAAVPSGDAYRACERVLGALRQYRIHLVHVGEIEDLVPAVGGHGAAWVAEVLEGKLHETSASDQARVLMGAVLKSLDGGD